MRAKWSEKQKKIYDGLASIGEEIAGFYEGGLQIYYGNLSNGAYFLIHAAREIDGRLNDIFAVDFNPDNGDQNRHKKAILYSLGEKGSEQLASDWYKISKELHKFAHRHGAWKKPRLFEEAKPMWDDFEHILEKLVGSYYAVIERIEHIGRIDNIGKGAADALCNILKMPVYYKYFFRKETNIKWFTSLYEKGFLDASCIEHDLEGNTLFWGALDYLERVSEQLGKHPKMAVELMKIISNLVGYSRSKRKINNYHIWWYCVKILNNIPNDLVIKHLVENKESPHFEFKVWLSEWVNKDTNSDLTISDVSEKLLKKFLNDKQTISLAKHIINAITDIKRSEKKDYFSKESEALLRWKPYWVIKSLQQQAEKIGQVCGKETVFLFADKLKLALECKKESSYAILELDKDIYRIEVSRKRVVSSEKEDIIEYRPDKYLCKLDKYSDDQVQENTGKDDYGFLYHNEPKETAKGEEEIEGENQSKFITELEKYLLSNIDWRKDPKYAKKLQNLYNNFFEDYSRIWFTSVEDGGKDHASRTEEVLTIVLRDVLLAKWENNPVTGKQVINAFLTDKYPFPIFKKLALYCINKFWDNDNMDRFRQFVVSKERALDDSDWEVEVFDILKNHNGDFDKELAELIKKQIRNVPEYYRKENWMAAQWQFNRLSPLKDNEEFKPLYSEAVKKVKFTKEYTPERTAIKGGFVSHSSPLSSSEILEKPNSELVEYLCKYKGADFRHGAFEDEPDREGLANTLQAAVKGNPKKFTDDIDLFYNAPYYYAHYLMWGLRDAWNANKDLDWEKVFAFCQKFLKRPKLIEEAIADQGSDSGKGKYIWFIEDVMGLIQGGSSKDERAFDPKYFPQIWGIFESVIPLLKVDSNPQTDRNALTYALNTTLGKVVEAFIVFSLRVARAKKAKPEEWGEKFERFFEKGIEAYVWFGRYLPNVNYLDEKLTHEKIKELSAPEELGVNWQAFMEGYLKGSYVYDTFYKLMRPNYIKALKNQISDDYMDKRLVQHIAIWYIRGKEELSGKNSLFRMMLEDVATPEKKSRWLEVVSFFWSLSKRTLKEKSKDDELSQQTVDRILAFWKWTAKEAPFVKEKLGDEYATFLGRLAELTILLPELDKEAEKLLSLSAPHVECHREAPFFIEYLTKFQKKEELVRAGKIYLSMLKSTTPTFRQEDIQTIVRRMYETKDSKVKKDADEICNTYGRRGIHFLKDLFFEFNK